MELRESETAELEEEVADERDVQLETPRRSEVVVPRGSLLEGLFHESEDEYRASKSYDPR